jgi:transketolase
MNSIDTNKTVNSYWIRKLILQQAMRAKVGHIGSSLSIADILVALYSQILHIPTPKDPERDRFILSKGHASLALYSALYLKGVLSKSQFETYGTDGTILGVHPEHIVPGVDFSTGSLGHGLSFGVGSALAAKMQKSKRRVFVLISDGECNEGSIWEAMMFAGHHEISNLVVIIDLNGQQALDYTQNVLRIDKLGEHLELFGWDVHHVDGNNVQQITDTISGFDTSTGKPHVIIAHTIFGKGVSFMENKIEWHYLPMDEEKYQLALSQIEQQCEQQ